MRISDWRSDVCSSDLPTQACELLLCAEVASEDLGESRAVREVEKAERTDLPVQLDRVDSRAKDDIGHDPLIDLGDVVDGGHITLTDGLGAIEVLHVVYSLEHHHADECLHRKST